MLNPEIWNFKEPESTLNITKQSDFDQKFLSNDLNNFYYNHLVTVIVPDCLVVPGTLTDVLNTDCEYYKINKFNFSELINTEFLSSFVKSGKLTILSVNTRIDNDDCVAVTPSGHLILNLTKETYQTFGLDGKTSHFQAKLKSRYIVTVNLKELTRSKVNFTKTKECLRNLGEFTILLNWEPPNEDVCPSSIAKYFSDLDMSVHLGKNKYKRHTINHSVKIPKLDQESFDKDDLADFIEWLGMVSISGNFEGGPVNFVTTYETPEPYSIVKQIQCFQWQGMYNCTKIQELIIELKKFRNEENLDWVAVYIQGFSDSPVAWRLEEHHYFTNGDNAILYVLSKHDKNLVCKQYCSKKRYK